jgi:hypothetical protein
VSVDVLLKPPGGGLSARFFLVGYLPTCAATLFAVTLVWAGAPGPRLSFGRAWHTAAHLGAGELALLGVGVLLGAILLQPFQLPALRLLEGYWPGWLEPAAALLRRGQARRRARLAKRAELPADPGTLGEAAIQRIGLASGRLRRLFPPEQHLRPTALGNILTAMETYAGASYGWDALVAWPRLYPCLPDPVRATVDERRNVLDSAAQLAATGTLLAPVTAALLARAGWWELLTLAPVTLAWLGYLGSLRAATAYAETVTTAFDLGRFALLDALHIALPADRDTELATSRELSDLWRQAAPTNLPYHHSPRP